MKEQWLAGLALFLGHWREALMQGGVFVMGALSAIIVLRFRLRFLMEFPLWMSKRLLGFLARGPSTATLFGTIFCFNAVAMFCYMMTGVIDPLLPTAVCFLTGMNIAIVAAVMPALARGETELTVAVDPEEARQQAPSRLELVCFLLTLVIELPVFWVSMGMGSTIAPPWWPEVPAEFGPVLPRMIAYGLVSVPLLCLSAAIEATGIRAGLKRQPPAPPNEPPDA